MLGLVITMLPTKGPDAYGYGHYGYGYGYTEDEDGNKSKAPIEKIKA